LVTLSLASRINLHRDEVKEKPSVDFVYYSLDLVKLD